MILICLLILQEDTKIFINQDTKLFVSGERILFPAVVQNEKNRVTVAHDLACVQIEGQSIIDTLDVFDTVETE